MSASMVPTNAPASRRQGHHQAGLDRVVPVCMAGDALHQIRDGVDAEQPHRCGEHQGDVGVIQLDAGDAHRELEHQDDGLGDQVIPLVVRGIVHRCVLQPTQVFAVSIVRGHRRRYCRNCISALQNLCYRFSTIIILIVNGLFHEQLVLCCVYS